MKKREIIGTGRSSVVMWSTELIFRERETRIKMCWNHPSFDGRGMLREGEHGHM